MSDDLDEMVTVIIGEGTPNEIRQWVPRYMVIPIATPHGFAADA